MQLLNGLTLWFNLSETHDNYGICCAQVFFLAIAQKNLPKVILGASSSEVIDIGYHN